MEKQSKDIPFFRWNKTNIMANLLQAEDHLCTVIDKIATEHAACVFKHLTVALGESMEISKHCVLADPENCTNYKKLANDIYKVKNDLEDNGIDTASLPKIRSLRKQFENITNASTDNCELGFCNFDIPKKQDSNIWLDDDHDEMS